MPSTLFDRSRSFDLPAASDVLLLPCSIQAQLALPLLPDYSPATATDTGLYHAYLPAALLAQLRRIGDADGDMLPAILLAAFTILLSRYANQPRLQLGIAQAPGEACALDLDLAEARPLSALAAQLHDTLLQVSEHRQPASQEQPNIAFAYHYEMQPSQRIAQALPSVEGDLRLELTDSLAGIEATWIYQAGRFAGATIARMHRSFLTLLLSIADQPAQPINQLPLLSAPEQRQLLVEWNATATAYPENLCIHQLFEAQAARTPDAIALVFGEQQISYRTLNRRANRLARRLQELGVGPEVMVGLCMERSPEQILSVFAILKAGGAYVPLDPGYPRERLALMLADTNTPILLTQQRLLDRLPAHPHMICVDDETPALEDADDLNLDTAVAADNLAYVIYTSGSTGRPKGVLIEQRGLVNHSYAMISSHALDASDRVLQFSSLGFDASASTLFSALIVGATLVLPQAAPSELLGHQLTQLCEEQRVTIIQLPASIWHRWVDDLAARGKPFRVPLKVLLVGGESPAPDKLLSWEALTGRPMLFLNAYGPTEATITATLYQAAWGDARAVELASIPMGRPLANKQIYLLDDQLRPVPIGAPGEVYIGGVGIARGYLNRPDLTAERFIDWTPPALGLATSQAPVRLYRTGDLARYHSDGNLEFLGRVDQQVKLRGFRIELGEIEATLRQHPAVRDAAVLAREERPGLQRLVGYIVAHEAATHTASADHLPDELRSFLREKLPDYMIPAPFVMLEALPLTHNGKLDRRALPAPALDRSPDQPEAEPLTPEHTMLATIWAQVLGRPHVRLHDDFFAFGGHSLLAAHAISLINAALGRDIPLRVLYEAPTVAAFARAIRHTEPMSQSACLNLADDVKLDAAITAVGVAAPRASAPTAIFLTGATGFLGAFLLQELLLRTEATLYCLVRAANAQEAGDRLKQTLLSYQLWRDDWRDRIVPVLGDLREAQLGLSTAAFESLAATIDVIYHAGAQVHYMHPYETLREVNVRGSVEILRLACQDHIKPIHYISTLAVAATGAGTRIYEDDELSPCTSEMGYIQSKWVAEGILRLARERGFSIAIYRPGRVGGHSQTGAVNRDDFFMRLLSGCLQLGLAPNIPMTENLMPVDYVAQAIVQLAQQPALSNQTLHLLNPQPTSWQWVVGVAEELGYSLRKAPYAEWYDALVQATLSDQSQVMQSLVMLMPADQPAANWVNDWAQQDFDMSVALRELAKSGLSCPSIDRTFIEHILADSARRGLLDAPAAAIQAIVAS